MNPEEPLALNPIVNRFSLFHGALLAIVGRFLDAFSWCSIRGSSMSSSRATFSAIFCRTKWPAWWEGWGWPCGGQHRIIFKRKQHAEKLFDLVGRTRGEKNTIPVSN